jgi:hypothetical protein
MQFGSAELETAITVALARCSDKQNRSALMLAAIASHSCQQKVSGL